MAGAVLSVRSPPVAHSPLAYLSPLAAARCFPNNKQPQPQPYLRERACASLARSLQPACVQLLYVYHLVGPFLQRFQQERTRCMLEIGVAFYEMLQAVDQHSQHLSYMDPICDFLYHIKYMFTGDSVKDQVEKIILTLRPAMKLRLRFITHTSKMEPAAASVPQPSSSVSSPAPQSNPGPSNLPLSGAQ